MLRHRTWTPQILPTVETIRYAQEKSGKRKQGNHQRGNPIFSFFIVLWVLCISPYREKLSKRPIARQIEMRSSGWPHRSTESPNQWAGIGGESNSTRQAEQPPGGIPARQQTLGLIKYPLSPFISFAISSCQKLSADLYTRCHSGKAKRSWVPIYHIISVAIGKMRKIGAARVILGQPVPASACIPI